MYCLYIIHESEEIVISTKEKYNKLPELIQELSVLYEKNDNLDYLIKLYETRRTKFKNYKLINNILNNK